MTSFAPLREFDSSYSCPVCGGDMEVRKVGSVPWAARTAGEQLTFRCGTCGLVRSEWRAIPLMNSPDLSPATRE
jgi:uncharacterized Zn finger protein